MQKYFKNYIAASVCAKKSCVLCPNARYLHIKQRCTARVNVNSSVWETFSTTCFMNVSGETESRRNDIAARALGIKHGLPKYAPSQKIKTTKKKEIDWVYNDEKLRISEWVTGTPNWPDWSFWWLPLVPLSQLWNYCKSCQDRFLVHLAISLFTA